MSKKGWITRHRKEHFYSQAKQEGYRARAVYKLKQMDERFHLFSGITCVLDLCCSPGSWLEYSIATIHTKSKMQTGASASVVGVDLFSVRPIPGVAVLRADITKDAIFEQIKPLLSAPPELVLSDCSPHVSGHREADHEMQAFLFGRALEIARRFLVSGGIFVGKLFQGLEFNRIIRELQNEFVSVQSYKPKASRSTSPEMYIVAKGFQKRDGEDSS